MNYISKLVNQYLKHRHTPEVEAKVQQWLIDGEHADEKDSALHEYWNSMSKSDTVTPHKALIKVKRRLGMDERRGTVIPMRRKLLRVAAVLLPLLLAGAGYWYANRPVPLVEITVLNGQHRQITLPDGSQVWVNAGSTLTYPEKFSGNRIIQLSGEAYFSVTKDPKKPFIVQTERISVQALGTEFDIIAYPDDDKTTTALVSGKIQVDIQGGKSYLLSPNQQLSVGHDTSNPEITKITAGDVLAKRDGGLIFDDATLVDILRAVERKYNVVITLKDHHLSSDGYSVKFIHGETFEQVMNVLEDVTGGFEWNISQ